MSYELVNLIDADSIVYAAGFACQRTIYDVTFRDRHAVLGTARFDNLLDVKEYILTVLDMPLNTKLTEKDCARLADIVKHIDVEPIENCLHTVKIMMDKIERAVPAIEHLVFLSGDFNFRYIVDPNYKANRSALHKPFYFKEIREYLIKHYDAQVVAKIEADDAIGLKHTILTRRHGVLPVVTSIDKDLEQLAGTHYNWKTGKLYKVEEAAAKYFFYEQLLTGDATDNIKGLPKVGKAKAAKILSGIDFTEPGAEDEAVRRIGLAYACHPDFDDPEAELMKTWQLVKILTEPPVELPDD